jgi:hypothetical protein
MEPTQRLIRRLGTSFKCYIGYIAAEIDSQFDKTFPEIEHYAMGNAVVTESDIVDEKLYAAIIVSFETGKVTQGKFIDYIDKTFKADGIKSRYNVLQLATNIPKGYDIYTIEMVHDVDDYIKNRFS